MVSGGVAGFVAEPERDPVVVDEELERGVAERFGELCVAQVARSAIATGDECSVAEPDGHVRVEFDTEHCGDRGEVGGDLDDVAFAGGVACAGGLGVGECSLGDSPKRFGR